MIFAVAALLAATQPAPTFMPATSPQAPQSSVHSHPMMPAGGPALPSKEDREKSMAQAFEDADTNHDGSLSRAEFYAAGERNYEKRRAAIAEFLKHRQQLQSQGGASVPVPPQHP